jgi:SAM-dependent methyltransferase
MLKGMSADRIIGLYERHAGAFDAQRSRGPMERAWLDRFTALIPAGGMVLDLGCGMGEPMAAHLIGAGFAVTGVDSAPTLLGLCRARFPRQEWVLADMRGLDLGRRFDGILAWDSFFHLDHADQRAMFGTFARHAAPGAALMFTSGPAEGVALGCFEGEVLHHASLSPAEYRELLARHGFAVVAHRAEDQDCGGHTIWLARRMAPQAASTG